MELEEGKNAEFWKVQCTVLLFYKLKGAQFQQTTRLIDHVQNNS